MAISYGACAGDDLQTRRRGLPISGNIILACTSAITEACISPQAMALLNSYYPLPNINTLNSTDPDGATTTRRSRTRDRTTWRSIRVISASWGSRQGRGSVRRISAAEEEEDADSKQNQLAAPVLRQNINASYNYSHSASDVSGISFCPWAAQTESDGNAVNLGYVVNYGRLSNNASINWNRNQRGDAQLLHRHVNNNPAERGRPDQCPNQASNFADSRFYNGLPTIGLTQLCQGISNHHAERVDQPDDQRSRTSWHGGTNGITSASAEISGGCMHDVDRRQQSAGVVLTFTGYATAGSRRTRWRARAAPTAVRRFRRFSAGPAAIEHEPPGRLVQGTICARMCMTGMRDR